MSRDWQRRRTVPIKPSSSRVRKWGCSPAENDYWVTNQPDGFSGDGLHVLSPKSGRDKRLISEFLVQSGYLIS
jgi:hypothetical protein